MQLRRLSMNGDKPMGRGTRAHSIAMAVITESPMQMLSGATFIL